LNATKADVLVVGGGAAGLRAAIEAASAGLSVVLIAKGRLGKCGATLVAGAEVDTDGASALSMFDLPAGSQDSPAVFAADMLKAGEEINNVDLVRIHVSEAPHRVRELVDWGAKVYGVIHSPGHTYPRGLALTGSGIMAALLKKAREYGNLDFAEDTMVTDLVVFHQRVRGAVALDFATGEIVHFQTKAVVLATGGCQSLYKLSDAPSELTGDGFGMAFRAGASLVDMEFVQFLISTMVYEPMTVAPIQQLLYKGAWLLNSEGERFMKRYDPANMERSTRDVVARAMMTEVLHGRGKTKDCVYLSLQHMTAEEIDEIAELYSHGTFATSFTFDSSFFDKLKSERLEVFPAAHYFCGGIKISPHSSSSVEGLFAAGEVSGGTDGANRLAGNALTNALVQGRIAGTSAASFARKTLFHDLPTHTVGQLERKIDLIHFSKKKQDQGKVSAIKLRKSLQEVCSKKLGVLRNRTHLEEALSFIGRIEREMSDLKLSNRSSSYNREWLETLELPNLLLTAKIIAKAALLRQESRGSHFRLDFPARDERWRGNIRVAPRGSGTRMDLAFQPLSSSQRRRRHS
jgi:succinate dehydrogenase/fumarate reductase flavoprotein subunit